jgi:hypothetical protein
VSSKNPIYHAKFIHFFRETLGSIGLAEIDPQHGKKYPPNIPPSEAGQTPFGGDNIANCKSGPGEQL